MSTLSDSRSLLLPELCSSLQGLGYDYRLYADRQEPYCMLFVCTKEASGAIQGPITWLIFEGIQSVMLQRAGDEDKLEASFDASEILSVIRKTEIARSQIVWSNQPTYQIIDILPY